MDFLQNNFVTNLTTLHEGLRAKNITTDTESPPEIVAARKLKEELQTQVKADTKKKEDLQQKVADLRAQLRVSQDRIENKEETYQADAQKKEEFEREKAELKQESKTLKKDHARNDTRRKELREWESKKPTQRQAPETTQQTDRLNITGRMTTTEALNLDPDQQRLPRIARKLPHIRQPTRREKESFFKSFVRK